MLSTERKIPLVVWEAWIEHTTGSERHQRRRADQAGIPRREGVRTTPPEQRYRTEVQPGSVARREHSSERAGPSRARRCYKQTGETAADTAPSL
ncbi:hypothetical protein EVAR_46066_1 [Eumeta japonica]|uniref:Uncharacterized protein n=1 Tax=Eumeta variegata TaxID=151549 RepID=A0A4C1SLG7_EUMVA|nr:hypothetical protein EVAR_46066_1 [Eumeta japonica]